MITNLTLYWNIEGGGGGFEQMFCPRGLAFEKLIFNSLSAEREILKLQVNRPIRMGMS